MQTILIKYTNIAGFLPVLVEDEKGTSLNRRILFQGTWLFWCLISRNSVNSSVLAFKELESKWETPVKIQCESISSHDNANLWQAHLFPWKIVALRKSKMICILCVECGKLFLWKVATKREQCDMKSCSVCACSESMPSNSKATDNTHIKYTKNCVIYFRFTKHCVLLSQCLRVSAIRRVCHGGYIAKRVHWLPIPNEMNAIKRLRMLRSSWLVTKSTFNAKLLVLFSGIFLMRRNDAVIRFIFNIYSFLLSLLPAFDGIFLHQWCIWCVASDLCMTSFSCNRNGNIVLQNC